MTNDDRPDYRWIKYDLIDEGQIAIISLNRPDKRNAQHRGLLVELDEAFREAEADDDVRVVILRGEGPAFSSGHDLGSKEHMEQRAPGPGQHPSYQIHGGTMTGIERYLRQEWEYFFDNTRRWRDLRKVTIASVKGDVLAAGLMIMWACDLIVAAPETTFGDVVGSRLGMCGVEYFAHPWEFGPRKAKELLLTGDTIGATEAHQLGMVSKIFPADRLDQDTIAFARRIAALPTMASLLIKSAVNQAQDAQGFSTALKAAFTMHELNHAHWALVTSGESFVMPSSGDVTNLRRGHAPLRSSNSPEN